MSVPLYLLCQGPGRDPTRGRGQTPVDLLVGLSLGLGVLAMSMQAWGLHRQWLADRDARQELFERTPFLNRLLLRLSRQAGSRALWSESGQWQIAPAYVALPPGTGPTWVHARDIHAAPAEVPNCQNTRVWAQDAASAPSHLRDQFAWVDGQLKCKDLAQSNARWQAWVEQVRGWQAMLAWQTMNAGQPSWRWRPVGDTPTQGSAVGVRLCLAMDSVTPMARRPPLGKDCAERPLSDHGRAWRVWTRAWALRVVTP